MEAMGVFLLVIGLGAIIVVGVAHLLRQSSRLSRLSTGRLLLISHTLIVLFFLLVAPLMSASEPQYSDVYLPYLLVPGIHIYHPSNLLFGRVVFPRLLESMESYPASVLCIEIGPGLVGLLVGGLQWYILGFCWDRLAGKCQQV
jgi:hypothetical protein